MKVPLSLFSCHPSMEEWREVHKKSKPTPTHKPKKANSNTPPKRQQTPPTQTPMETEEATSNTKNQASPLKEDKVIPSQFQGPVKKKEWTQTSLQKNMHPSNWGHLASKGASGTPIITA
ncbi:hypothetical protein DSO57_1017287 [Entomophthora muscae]|uniref:Uncharacterized protein n=1 Tax=Entomophthora muscae TaxID=34485 RepID=A0ACC2UQH2_9FUNG|nr:hypothetical protein DSO57_1017287 [Entomophthora muscae]